MSKYELVYYNSRGYAEPIRILFFLVGKWSGRSNLDRNHVTKIIVHNHPNSCMAYQWPWTPDYHRNNSLLETLSKSRKNEQIMR